MNIILLGGTGAIGVSLCNFLKIEGHNIYVTTRKIYKDKDGINYITGNAIDISFLSELMKSHYDCVIDFMIRSEENTQRAMDVILPSCKQYIFLSSSRVFAPVDVNKGERITENSPKLLDTCKDVNYKNSKEYAIEKAREENLFYLSKYKNWTIVRPTLTYNTYRLQLAYGEKEDWLFRLLNGKSIIFPKNMVNIKTSMVHGDDVAKAILKLIGNPQALSNTFNIVSNESITWGEVLEIYTKLIEKRTGTKARIHYIENYTQLTKNLGNYYQVKYARAVDRCFSNDKLIQLIGPINFIPVKEGLTSCLNKFLNDIKFQEINWYRQAYYDKICNEFTSFKLMPSIKIAIKYFFYRIGLKRI